MDTILSPTIRYGLLKNELKKVQDKEHELLKEMESCYWQMVENEQEQL